MAFTARFRVKNDAYPYRQGATPQASLLAALEAGIIQGLPSAMIWLRQNVTWIEGEAGGQEAQAQPSG